MEGEACSLSRILVQGYAIVTEHVKYNIPLREPKIPVRKPNQFTSGLIFLNSVHACCIFPLHLIRGKSPFQSRCFTAKIAKNFRFSVTLANSPVSGRGEGVPLQPRPFCLAANPRLITQYQLPTCANAPCVYYRPVKSPVARDFGENLSASVSNSAKKPAKTLLVCYHVRSQPEQMDVLTRLIPDFTS